jgi:hypothetical protein
MFNIIYPREEVLRHEFSILTDMLTLSFGTDIYNINQLTNLVFYFSYVTFYGIVYFDYLIKLKCTTTLFLLNTFLMN